MGMNSQITMLLIPIYIFVLMCALVRRTPALKPAALRCRQRVANEKAPLLHRQGM
jgi:hypothetical protein